MALSDGHRDYGFLGGISLAISSAFLGAVSTYLHVFGVASSNAEAYGFVYIICLATASLSISAWRRIGNRKQEQISTESGSLSFRFSIIFLSVCAYIGGHFLLFRAAEIATPNELSMAGRSFLIFSIIFSLTFKGGTLTYIHGVCLLLFTASSLLVVDATDEVSIRAFILGLATYFLFAVYHFALAYFSTQFADSVNGFSAALTAVFMIFMAPSGFTTVIELQPYQVFWPLLSACLYASSFSIFYQSLKSLDYSSASYVRATSPVFVLILSFIFSQDGISMGELIGILGVVATQMIWFRYGKK